MTVRVQGKREPERWGPVPHEDWERTYTHYRAMLQAKSGRMHQNNVHPIVRNRIGRSGLQALLSDGAAR